MGGVGALARRAAHVDDVPGEPAPVPPPPPAQPPAAAPAAPTPFRARFRTELVRHPWRLAGAVTATLGVMAGLASIPASSAEAPAPVRPAAVGRRAVPPTPTPGDRAAYHGLARRAAADVCPGLPPSVLSAIAEVESRLGLDTSVSTAGARGPMQFLPATFDAYASDGNEDGRAEVDHPVDAVYTAARYLCANGGADPARLRGAIWNYNRSPSYVRRVLTMAGVHSV